jgi:hypothetical protein
MRFASWRTPMAPPACGNSIANYVPLANFLVRLDEGRRWH